MKSTTNDRSGFTPAILLAGCLSIAMLAGVAFGAVGDDAKLKELEQAMKSAPTTDGNLVKKPKTRAIVFDNEPQTAAQAPPSSGIAAGQIKDCNALPADVKTTAVDFVVNFKVNSAEVAHSSEGLLQQIAKILSLSPDRCVLVEGHSDASGNLEKNIALSKSRADSVVKFVVEKAGLDGKRFVAVGKGPNEPLKNTSPHDPKNRRVVFKVVD